MDTKKTILIVDDSEFVRSYHSYILEQADFQVITAVDGSDGLEKLYSQLLRPGPHRYQYGQHGWLRVHPARARRCASTARCRSSSCPRKAKARTR